MASVEKCRSWKCKIKFWISRQTQNAKVWADGSSPCYNSALCVIPWVGTQSVKHGILLNFSQRLKHNWWLFISPAPIPNKKKLFDSCELPMKQSCEGVLTKGETPYFHLIISQWGLWIRGRLWLKILTVIHQVTSLSSFCRRHQSKIYIRITDWTCLKKLQN